MNQQSLRYYEFGPFRLSVTDKLLQLNDRVIPLTPKLIDTLVVLVENNGRVLTKGKLMETLWPDSFVEESSLTQNISLLRKTLAENDGAQYIETIPKRGYRFVGEVREVDGTNCELGMQESSSTQRLIEAGLVQDTDEPEESPTNFRSVANVRPRQTTKRSVLLTFLAASVTLASVVAFQSFQRSRSANGKFAPKSIAVLPFKTIGSETDPELLGIGMADAVILKLTRLNKTIVLPTSSVFKYTNREKDVLSIGRELEVDAILDGTAQRAGDRVRVTAMLIRSSDGKSLWSGQFEQNYREMFGLQEAIATRLVGALVPNIEEPDKLRIERPTENADAYRAYLSGLYFWNKRGKDNLTKAISYLEESIKQDPDFALAHAILADCYYLNADGDLKIAPRPESLSRAASEATRALELDDNLAEAHTVKADLSLTSNDIGSADREFRRALELNPNYAVAHLRYGYLLFSQAKLQEASAQMQLAQELDPVSPVTNTSWGFMLFMSRDYEGAIRAYHKALELQPDLIPARANLGEAYAIKGMFDEALAEFEKLKDSDMLLSAKGEIYAQGLAGRSVEARRTLSELQQSTIEKQLTPYDYAILYAAVGDKDKAFHALEKVIERLEKVSGRGLLVTRLKFDPQLDLLRGDARFGQYLGRLEIKRLSPQEADGL